MSINLFVESCHSVSNQGWGSWLDGKYLDGSEERGLEQGLVCSKVLASGKF